MDKITERLRYLIEKAQQEYSNDYYVFVIPLLLSRKFIGYCSMQKDLELLLEYVATLRGENEGLIKSALTYALISLYGKCFTDASKGSYPKLEPTEVFKHSNKHSITHELLMELRHKFIAHRNDCEGEVGISYLIIPKAGGIEQSQIRFSQVKQVSFPVEDLNKIEALLKYLHSYLHEKIQKSAEKVNNALFSVFTPEQILFMLINNVQE